MPKAKRRISLPPPKSEASKGPLSLADYEIYSGIEVPEQPFIVRLDGWAWHSLAARLKWKKPFDQKLSKTLAKVAEGFFIPFNPTLAYLFSDEINFLFLRPTSFRRIEKIDSIFAGYASALCTSLLKHPVVFDCRVIPLPKQKTRQKIRAYLIWRQAECFRNHNNAWAQWVAINKEKLSPEAANRKLSGMKTAALVRYCKSHGIDLSKTPAWQRNGVLLRWETYEKTGYDPIKKIKTRIARRRVISNPAPDFRSAEGEKLIDELG
jgi:tRNA(His) 5'-end guanylyltransferase